MKTITYEECYSTIVAIWRDEGGETLDDIALMATINSVLANRFPYYFWTGFYRVVEDRLVVGPELQASLARLGDAPVLLVDDLADSRWTVTVAGRALRRAGAASVLPFVLALTA